jgi:hypothetical protein
LPVVSKTTLAEAPYLNRLPWSVRVTPEGTWTVDDGVAEEAALDGLDGLDALLDGEDADGELEEVAPCEEPPVEPELHPARATAAAVLTASRDSTGRTRVGRGRTCQQPSRRSAK